MLKGNLSTRPFYNEGAVNVILAAAAVAGLALAAFNATRVLEYSGERAQRTAAQTAAETAARDVRTSADREQQKVDKPAMQRLGAETQQANDLIDKRLFSWTVFFGLVEKTLPLDARLVAVAPTTERGEFRIAMTVNAKRPEDLSAFLDALPGDRRVLRHAGGRAAAQRGRHLRRDGVGQLCGARPDVGEGAGRGGRREAAMSLARRIFVERRRVVLPLLVFLIANIAVLVLVVFPLQQSVASAESARVQATLSLENARKQQKPAVDQKAGKERADIELKKFYTQILPKDFRARGT